MLVINESHQNYSPRKSREKKESLKLYPVKPEFIYTGNYPEREPTYLQIYPYPAKDRLFIQSDRPVRRGLKLEIIDPEGNTVRIKELPATGYPLDCELNIAALLPGRYMICLQGEGIRLLMNFIKKCEDK